MRSALLLGMCRGQQLGDDAASLSGTFDEWVAQHVHRIHANLFTIRRYVDQYVVEIAGAAQALCSSAPLCI